MHLTFVFAFLFLLSKTFKQKGFRGGRSDGEDERPAQGQVGGQGVEPHPAHRLDRPIHRFHLPGYIYIYEAYFRLGWCTSCTQVKTLLVKSELLGPVW